MPTSRGASACRLFLIEKKRVAGLDLDVMRTAIAAAMARSKREMPHYYLQHQADVTPCEEWLARTNVDRTPNDRLLLGALAIKSVASACRRPRSMPEWRLRFGEAAWLPQPCEMQTGFHLMS